MGFALVQKYYCDEYDEKIEKVIFASRDEELVGDELERLIEKGKQYKKEHDEIAHKNERIRHKNKNLLREYLVLHIDKLIPILGRPIDDVDITCFVNNHYRTIYKWTRKDDVRICGPQLELPFELFEGVPEPEPELPFNSYDDYYTEDELMIVECEVI